MSLKSLIISYVKEKYPNPVHGGDLERLAMNNGKMASNAGRRARELAESGIFERLEGNEAVYRYIYQPNEVAPVREMSLF